MSSSTGLGLCMIAKNEEKNIRRCIESAAPIVDEIVVVDTGSTDQTAKIARELGARVFSCPWSDDFSAARNYALAKADAKWLLLLDADEALFPEDYPALLEFIEETKYDGAHFSVYNYLGAQKSDNYTLHNAFRLLRNCGDYEFVGEIHEQIARKDKQPIVERFPVLTVRLHHYGYMDDAVQEKQKRSRNLSILRRQLENMPENPFLLFNVGNEYIAQNDFRGALSYYERSFDGFNAEEAYAPHLLLRMASCHENLRQYKSALLYLELGIALYPACTDFEYMRGCILHKLGRYTLAAAALEKCLRQGEAPLSLRMIDQCGSFRPAFSLGLLYEELEDYEKALKYYHMALKFRPDLYSSLYRITAVLNLTCEDKGHVKQTLFSYFAEKSYPPNVLLACDILIGEGLYPQALEELTKTPPEKYSAEFSFLYAKALFFTQKYEDALPLFEKLAEENCPSSILPRLLPENGSFLFLLRLLGKRASVSGENDFLGEPVKERLLALADNREALPFDDTADTKTIVAQALPFFDALLKIKEFELFEKLLPFFNLMDDKTVLLHLARLYHANGFPGMAAKSVLSSISQLNAVDRESLHILQKCLP
jgi:glycosyltransferase involved in cell wall biosynthesis